MENSAPDAEIPINSAPAILADTYDGVAVDELRAMIDVPELVVYETIGSTLDVAHELATRGAPSGTLVLADSQSAGRGRGGRRWSAPSGSGIWMTLIERPADRTALDVLSLRIGLGAAHTLDEFAPEPVRLKWPNDVYVEERKLAGVLVETRWRADSPEWVAIGLA